MIVLCLGGLWLARSHLRSVGRGAFGPRGQVNDDDEIMSYRAAVFSTLGGSLFMILVLNAAGLPLWAGVTMVRSCWMMLTLAYDVYLKHPTLPNFSGWLQTGVAGVMGTLMFLRHRVLWWPLHSLGLPISATRIMDLVWFSGRRLPAQCPASEHENPTARRGAYCRGRPAKPKCLSGAHHAGLSRTLLHQTAHGCLRSTSSSSARMLPMAFPCSPYAASRW